MKFDDEEKTILDAFERGELKSVKNVKSEILRYETYAKATRSRKEKRINIRLSATDLEALQVIAVEEGIPYQTLITSVLHKFATGRLVDRKSDC